MTKFRHIWFSVKKEENRVDNSHLDALDSFTSAQVRAGITPDEMIKALEETGWQMCGCVNEPFTCMYYFKKSQPHQYEHIWFETAVNGAVFNRSDIFLDEFTFDRIGNEFVTRQEVFTALGKAGYFMTGTVHDTEGNTYFFAQEKGVKLSH